MLKQCTSQLLHNSYATIIGVLKVSFYLAVAHVRLKWTIGVKNSKYNKSPHLTIENI